MITTEIASGRFEDDLRLTILGASSSYLVVDVTGAAGCYRVGNELTFSLNYGALLTAMTSEYVEKRPVHGGALLYTACAEG